MVFSDPSFLFYFLPFSLVTYWVIGWRVRNLYLLLISFVFYASGGGQLVLLLTASALLTYYFGLRVEKAEKSSGSRIAKRVGVIILLASLLIWKYLGFFLDQISGLIRWTGSDADVSVSLVLPIAISFYTFQCISYLVDVGRREIKAEKNLITFLCYIFFFPHLLAGPVVRYSDVADQLNSKPQAIWKAFVLASPRFFWGLAKKVLIADQAAQIVDAVFGVPGYQLTAMDTVVGVVAYAVQIYFDFSGYSDMAISIARMFGINFQENFQRPYSSKSVTEFWRRWHISLSSWFRDYVYIPLGGNRNGSFSTYRNLLLIFVLTGFWHGANWTFLVWGLIHGAALISERLILRGKKNLGLTSRVLLRAWTVLVVMLGWLFFRSADLGQAFDLLGALWKEFGLGFSPLVDDSVTRQRLFWLAVGLSVFLLRGDRSFGVQVQDSPDGDLRRYLAIASGTLASLYVLSSSFSPFLYFQF